MTAEAKAAWAALVVTVGAALLYTTGWVYAARWFEQFGLGAVALDISKEMYFIWGAEVVADRGSKVVAACAGIGFAIGWWRLWATARLSAEVKGYLPYAAWGFGAPMLAWFGFALLYVMAAGVAERHAAEERATGFKDRPAVRVEFTGTEPPEAAKGVERGCHRLLLRTKDALILVRPHAGNPGLTLSTLVIPTAQIATLRVIPTPGPCP